MSAKDKSLNLGNNLAVLLEIIETATNHFELKEILAKMPNDFRELLELHYLEGLSYDQISEKKNITIPALKMRLFRARELFRNLNN